MEEINRQGIPYLFIYEGSTQTMINRLIKEKKSKRPLIASLSDDKIGEFVAKHLFERRFFMNKQNNN